MDKLEPNVLYCPKCDSTVVFSHPLSNEDPNEKEVDATGVLFRVGTPDKNGNILSEEAVKGIVESMKPLHNVWYDEEEKAVFINMKCSLLVREGKILSLSAIPLD